MKYNLEDYPLSVEPDNCERFYYIDDWFCCQCGKKGIWARSTMATGEYFVVCTSCRYGNLYRKEIHQIDFVSHASNREIFESLVAKESPYIERQKSVTNSISSLELSEAE